MAPRAIVQPARFSAHARLRALQADIMDLILERGLEPGDPLPTENELSVALGVGRNTLRESLKVLQALGVIQIRHGFGMFVAGSNFEALAEGLAFRARLSLRHSGSDARELISLREALESGLLPAAIDAMTPEVLQVLDGHAAELEAIGERAVRFAAVETAFHGALFQPLGNATLSELLDVFAAVSERISHEVPQPGAGTDSAYCYRQLCNALAVADKEKAARWLTRSFQHLRRAVEGAGADA